MVTVGDIQRGHPRELVDQLAGLAGVRCPDRVVNIVGRGEVEQRRARGHRAGDRVEAGRRLVGEEHDAGLRAQLDHVPGPIVLLVAARPLVLADDVLFVIVDGEAPGDAGLLMAPHPEPVEIQRGLILDHERRRLAQRIEVPARSGVHRGRVGIDVRRQIDLRAAYVKKTERIPVGELTRFFGADDIVGNGGNCGGILGRRTQCPERMDESHPRILSR
jgi:hypothetical protein